LSTAGRPSEVRTYVNCRIEVNTYPTVARRD
jgi:hypothetical protein